MLRTNPNKAAVLAHFGVSEADYLGGGSEAQVYALDADRVARIERSGDEAYLRRRQQFYASLRGHALPFALPEIEAVGQVAGVVYAVERRLPGRSLHDRYDALSAEQRGRAVQAYLEAAAQLQAITLDGEPYGELLTRGTPIRTADWRDYLQASIDTALRGGYADLATDVPGVDGVLAQVRARVNQLDGAVPKCLVHGDFGPANVLLADDLTVAAVVDFGYATLAGDARQDLAGALAFIELAPGYTAGESAAARESLRQRGGAELLDVLDLYRAYYAVYFSGCKDDDPATYWWCANTLRAWRAA